MTRLHYEYDTSFFNGYYKVQIRPTSPDPLSPEQHDMSTKSREPAVSGVADVLVGVCLHVCYCLGL